MVSASTLHVLCSMALFFVGILILKKTGNAAILALIIGFAKEVRDLFVNPWNMNLQALMSDCMSDLWYNMIGVLLGFLLFDIYIKTQKRSSRSRRLVK